MIFGGGPKEVGLRLLSLGEQGIVISYISLVFKWFVAF